MILESGSVSYGKATPYLPVIDLLKAYFKIHDRDDQREIREKVTGKLLTLDKSLESTLPAFLALLDVPVEDPTWQALDPSQRRQRDSWRRQASAASRESSPASDPAIRRPSLDRLRDPGDARQPSGKSTDGTAAPPGQLSSGIPTWLGKQDLTTPNSGLIRCRPRARGRFLIQLLGNDPDFSPSKQLLIERTEGNPFFLEESVRTLVETKVLAGERGNYRLEKKVESTQVPATVQAVLAARIDRLSPEEKQLLQSAAVIGKDIPFSLLQAITELSDEELRRGLTHLQAAEFLYETSLFPDLEYTFKHALTHEVAYGSLLHERQRALHARIVEAIERLYPDRLIEQVERLAHHAARGEVWGKALTYLRQAGAKADARSAFREAASYFEQALTALGHLPDDRETREQAIDLHFNLRNSLSALGNARGFLNTCAQPKPWQML